MLARCDEQAEVCVGIRRRRCGERGAAVVLLVLHAQLIAGETGASASVRGRILALAAFADPAAKLIGVEMRVAAVGDRREGAVGEREQCGIGAFHRARRVPGAGHRAHAFHAPAAE